MQQSILYFFQSIANPMLDTIVQGITLLGEEYFFILVVALFYWNISKESGLILGLVYIYSTIVNIVLKMIFMTPRPFEVLPDIAGKRIHTATGYSFPSGHTQGAASFFTALALRIRKRWFTVLAIFLMIAVAVSRVYLGVHWPVDVLGGLLIGTGLGYLLHRILSRKTNDERALNVLLITLEAAVLAVCLLYSLLAAKGWVNSEKVGDLFKAAGTSLGVVLGYLLQQKLVDFQIRGKLWKKILRYIIGIITTVALLAGLKKLFPYTNLFNFTRYFCVGLWLIFAFPWIAQKVGLFD